MKTIFYQLFIAIQLLSVFYSNAQQHNSNEELYLQIDKLIRPVADKELFSGVVLVVRSNEIVYHEAFGYADWENKVVNTKETRFGVASITKGMTGVIVEILIKKRKLNLDAPVEKFIPGFPKGQNGGSPTIAHLYRHRSGVPHRVTDEKDETQFFHAADIVDRVKKTGLLFEPGEKKLYSSAGYTVLARVIEIIEEKPFDQVLKELIFDPAAMKSAISENPKQDMPNLAKPYFLGTNDKELVAVSAGFKNLSFLTGAGSVYATAEDLFKFLKATQDGVFGQKIRDKQVDTNAASWRGLSGRTSGYECYLDVLSSENLSYVILTNLRSAANWQIRAQLRKLLMNEELAEIKLPPQVTELFQTAESLVGIYDNGVSRVVITLENGKLFRGDYEFYPTSGNKYYIPASGTVMKFTNDNQGKVDALIQLKGGMEISYPRIH